MSFRHTKQLTDEGIDTFIQRLRQAADACYYGDTLERELRIQVAIGCKHEEVREIAMNTPLILADLTAFAKELEEPLCRSPTNHAAPSYPNLTDPTEIEPHHQHNITYVEVSNSAFGSTRPENLLSRSDERAFSYLPFGGPKRGHFLFSGPDLIARHDTSFEQYLRALRLLCFSSPSLTFACEHPWLPASRGPD